MMRHPRLPGLSFGPAAFPSTTEKQGPCDVFYSWGQNSKCQPLYIHTHSFTRHTVTHMHRQTFKLFSAVLQTLHLIKVFADVRRTVAKPFPNTCKIKITKKQTVAASVQLWTVKFKVSAANSAAAQVAVYNIKVDSQALVPGKHGWQTVLKKLKNYYYTLDPLCNVDSAHSLMVTESV